MNRRLRWVRSHQQLHWMRTRRPQRCWAIRDRPATEFVPPT